MAQKRAAKKEGGLPIILRCLLFWFAPMCFLYIHLLTGRDGHEIHEDVVWTLLPGLLLLVMMSISFFFADLWFRCSGGLAITQISLQLLLMLWQSNALTILAIPKKPEPEASPIAVASATEIASASAKRGQMPLLARSRRGEAGGDALEEADSMSIVLPCLNETTTVIKTVNRFCERTPQELLKEIIVVDDGSSPPLADQVRKNVAENCRLRVLRHEKPWGLMIAKQTGGDAALGKYIGFYDCHVAPGKDWHVETVKLLREKPKRLVVPLITDLDFNTFDEKSRSAETAKCYIDFNADFWWYDDESDNIPVISGGLVATTREWWKMSGGFDPGMRGWGGENTDQSLRAWLCGGDVIRAKSSRIAHMWRVTSDPRTVAKYRFPGQTDNLARVAAIWFDEFASKFRSGRVDTQHLDVKQARAVREKLQCKPFIHFLHRFRRIYVDGGVLPDLVFKIRQQGTQNCISRSGGGYSLRRCASASWFHLANMIPKGFPPISASGVLMEKANVQEVAQAGGSVRCGEHKANTCAECPQGHGAGWCNGDCQWVFGDCTRKSAVFQKSERKTGSGIREWGTLYCFDVLQDNGPLPYQCDLTGKNMNQKYIWDQQGRIRHSSGKCLDAHGSSTKSSDCEKAAKWERIEDFAPPETKLYKEGVVSHGLTEDMPDH